MDFSKLPVSNCGPWRRRNQRLPGQVAMDCRSVFEFEFFVQYPGMFLNFTECS